MKPMFLRIFSAAAAALFAASCGTESPVPQGSDIQCAIGAGVELEAVCTLERSAEGESVSFLIHHPDGGFRRIEYDTATDQIGVGDGADALKVSEESTAEIAVFAIGEDRYRIPSEMLRTQPQ
ncbi:hypothetical protein FGU71_11940 [Erythrobacter insulae]|uniref:Lysozyme inhibitor n=1 Tax=Erythrobacter insulae TaxID=2584124 RepID=A0A547PED2_9SPHN|nr:hypothetical protein [Erythrobacter insulae]TRD12503.1 hypothetical protein FGU71_11940 [Erythrobacter insulae]